MRQPLKNSTQRLLEDNALSSKPLSSFESLDKVAPTVAPSKKAWHSKLQIS